MKNSINTRLAGRYFKPYSELVDGQSLGCLYTGIYRKYENGEIEYPLSVVLGEKNFSIYWHGYMKNDGVEHYGVHQLFSDDFTDQYNVPLENWLDQGKLVPLEVMGGNPYIMDESKSANKTYRDVYILNDIVLGDEERASRTLFENFVLDLLFDLQHSGAFRGHPARESFLGFVQSVPKILAICLKAEHQYARYQLSGSIDEKSYVLTEIEYLKNVEEKATSAWLFFLRSTAGSTATKDSGDNRWFLGVEEEHQVVYQKSSEKHLKKQAEDSIQWLLSRYDLLNAYRLQFGRVFSKYSIVLIFLLTVFAGYFLKMTPVIDEVFTRFHDFHWSFIGLFGMSFLVVSFLAGLFLERILLLVINVLFWLAYKIKNMIRKRTCSHSSKASPENILLSLPKIANNLKPKVLLASLAAWTFLLSTDFVWNLDFKLTTFKWWLLAAMAFVTFIFLSTHLTTFVSRTGIGKAWKVFVRIFFIGIVATLYSFIIGCVGMAFTGEKHFLEDETLCSYCSGFTHRDSISGHLLNQSGNCLIIEKKISEDSIWRNSFFEEDINLHTFCCRSGITCKGVLDSSEVLQNLYHYELRKDTQFIKHRVCFVSNISTEIDSENKGMSINHKMILVVEPLVFFTFIAVALGLMLEMGLQLQRSGIELD